MLFVMCSYFCMGCTRSDMIGDDSEGKRCREVYFGGWLCWFFVLYKGRGSHLLLIPSIPRRAFFGFGCLCAFFGFCLSVVFFSFGVSVICFLYLVSIVWTRFFVSRM